MSELKDFYDEVAKVAYDLYEKRGRIHGDDLADWLKAETIVKKRYEKEMAGVKEKPAAAKAKSPVTKQRKKHNV